MNLNGDGRVLPINGNGKQSLEFPGIHSKSIAEIPDHQVDMRQIIALARRRIILITGVAVAVTSGVVTRVVRQIPKYEGKFQLLVGSVSGDDRFEQLSESLKQNTGSQGSAPDYETQIQVLWSSQIMTPIVKKIQAQYPELDYNLLRTKLTISRLQQTKILEIRYQDSDPEKIQFILDQVAKGYVNYSRQEQQTTTQQGIQFVKDQLPKLQERVNQLQQQLQEFRQEYNLLDPDSQGQLLTQRASTIVQQRQDAQSQLAEAKALYNELQSQLDELGVSPKQAIAASGLSEAPRYQQLLNKLSEVETKIAIESARFTEESPTIQALREEQKNLLPLVEKEAGTALSSETLAQSDNRESLASPNSIRQEVTKKLIDTTNQIETLSVRQAEIARAENLMARQIKQLPIIARQYTDLQRELKVATESLNRFLAVRETLQIEAAQKTLPWQLIAPPQTPQKPISPNVPRGLILATVAGLLAGAGAGILAEKLDKAFHSLDELKESTGLPILGTIPFDKTVKKNTERKKTSLKVDREALELAFTGNHRYRPSPFLEAFRSLHTNLNFISPDRPIRSLVMSSAVPADGKSTTSIFLAQAAAAMGERVLLVDADLRRPQIHVRMDLLNMWGLSNAISSDLDVDNLIQESPMDENLFVLTAGQIPPDPTRLLNSKKMQNLVEYFQSKFDLVIFDMPPLLGLADARLLAAYTDGILMVVGLGKTDREVLNQVLYGLNMSHAKVLGLVANGVKDYTSNSYGYYHRYYANTANNLSRI
jgi:polysaccharide biosynthesis transport protein